MIIYITELDPKNLEILNVIRNETTLTVPSNEEIIRLSNRCKRIFIGVSVGAVQSPHLLMFCSHDKKITNIEHAKKVTNLNFYQVVAVTYGAVWETFNER